MKKFSRSFNGYNVDEVNKFLDDIIKRVDSIIREEQEIKRQMISKDNRIKELQEENSYIKNEMNSSITSAQEQAEFIKRLAKNERDAIINDARKNANRIVSDALIRAEKTEYEAQMLKKNVNLFKNRVRTMLNQQLDIIEDLDKIDLN